MTSFSIADGGATTFTDTTPDGGLVIDFFRLDNSFNVQINGVDLFVGGPAGAPNEAEFQIDSTAGQTVQFADGDRHGVDTPQVWQLGNTNGEPIVRLVINPDGTIALSGVKANDGPLEPLELFNGLTVNTAAIDAAWNDAGPNTIVVDQLVRGPTNATGEFDDIPCFASGTLIETTRGLAPIETLKVDDEVRTVDHGVRPIRWIRSRTISHAQLQAHPNLKPILIRAGALGATFPKQDLVVSPQHRILVSSDIARRMFGVRDVLIPAKKLLSLDGVEVLDDSPSGVIYWHMLFDAHEIIWSNGMPTESLFTGPQAMRAISEDGRAELHALFPEICEDGFKPTPARHIPQRGRRIEKLVQRHQANRKPLYCAAA